jgi:hypothetical protein
MEGKVAAPVQKTEITAVGILRADHETSLHPQKLAMMMMMMMMTMTIMMMMTIISHSAAFHGP